MRKGAWKPPEDGEARGYLEQKGFQVKRMENDELVFDCPLCGKAYGKSKKGHLNKPFYINQNTGLWSTFCCSKSGNLFVLRRLLGDQRPQDKNPIQEAGSAVMQSLRKQMKKKPKNQPDLEKFVAKAQKDLFNEGHEVTREYLQSRGFDLEVCREFGLGSSIEAGVPWLVIPTRNSLGEVQMVKKRRADGQREFKRVAGGVSGLFGANVAAGEWKRVYLTEGELDAVALTQMGFAPACSITAGANSMPEECLEELSSFDEVIICYDNDDAGKDGAKKAVEALGSYRCSVVSLPHKDAADCLKAKADTQVRRAIDTATPAGSDVVHIGSFAEEARSLRDPTSWGWPTQWSRLNKLLGGGLREQELVVVTGDTGTGKTTFVTDMLRHMAQRGKPVLNISPEMRPKDLCAKLISQVGKQQIRKMTDPEFEYANTIVSGLPYYVATTVGKIPRKEALNSIEYAVRRHGVKIVVLDHLDFILEGSRDDWSEQDDAVMDLVSHCQKLNICLILLVHPRKTNTDFKTGMPRLPDLDDIKGSSAVKQLAHAVLRIHRPRNPNRTKEADSKVVISALKMRNDAGDEGNEVLYFDPDTLRYSSGPSKTQGVVGQ